MKTFFMNDYGEGAHPLVMRRLMETNMEHTCGYGLDEYSLRAADVIREKCGQPGAAVHIMTGGTSANSIAIAAFLRPYEAAICAPTGHINVHETGAVEATGHKVLPCAAKDGKVTAKGVEAVCALHTDEHMVAPRLLYVSQPTEIGTVYHLDELKALREVCDRLGLILFVGRRAVGQRADQPGVRHDAQRFGRAGGLFLHRRHEKWPAFRRSDGYRQSGAAKGFPLYDQA